MFPTLTFFLVSYPLPPSPLPLAIPPSFSFIYFSKEDLSHFCDKRRRMRRAQGVQQFGKLTGVTRVRWKWMEEEKELQEVRITESLQISLQRFGMAVPLCSHLVPTPSPPTYPEQSCCWGWSRQVARCQGALGSLGCLTEHAKESPFAPDHSLKSSTAGCWGKECRFLQGANSEICRSPRRSISHQLEWACSFWHSGNSKGCQQVA